ncbi:MAG: hypothetical protein A2Y12_16080 [Planctomycetes bacterium GWF2_42_9]|nr:MAG: hypothetical protein A2Y12_16080 [Planctomycetes bacterium GWF2_42_9]
MKRKILNIVALSILAVIFSGCNANKIEGIAIDTHDSEKLDILWADVYQQNGEIWAYGALKQNGNYSAVIKTHVDIQVLSENGSIQYETFSNDLYVPKHRTGKGPGCVQFRVKLAADIPTGAKVNIKIHNNKHEQS